MAICYALVSNNKPIIINSSGCASDSLCATNTIGFPKLNVQAKILKWKSENHIKGISRNDSDWSRTSNWVCWRVRKVSVVSIAQVVLSELRVTGKNPQKQASFKSLKQRCSFFCIKMCRWHMLWSPIRALPVLEGLKKEDDKGGKMPWTAPVREKKVPLWHQLMTPCLAAACWIQFPFIPLHLLPLQSSAQTS